MRWLPLCVLLCLGCESLRYSHTSPSVRTLQDDPSFGDMYFGADSQFVFMAPGEARRPVADTDRREVLDVWNAPIAWEPSRSTSEEHLATTTEPLPGN